MIATFLHDLAPFAGGVNTLLLIGLAIVTSRSSRKIDRAHHKLDATHQDVSHAAQAASSAAKSAADAARIARDIGGTLRHTDPPTPTENGQ